MSFWYGALGTKAGVRAAIEAQGHVNYTEAEKGVKEFVLATLDRFVAKDGYGVSVSASGHVSNDQNSSSSITIEVKDVRLFLDPVPEEDHEDGGNSSA